MSDFIDDATGDVEELRLNALGEFGKKFGRPSLLDGTTSGDAILDVPEIADSVWGEGRKIGWVEGEPAWLFGPTGIGKTTAFGSLLKAAWRIKGMDSVLDLPVKEFTKPTLYIAADRPRQIKRALQRGFSEEHRDFLRERLTLKEGPTPYMLSNPEYILALAEDAWAGGFGQIFIDGIKDVASKLVDDEAGLAIKGALNQIVTAGIDVMVGHHARKSDGRPKSIDDMYGSSMMANSAGTIVVMWGNPGDVEVDVRNLKFADEEGVGPLKAIVDKRAGLIYPAPESRVEFFMLAKLSFTVRQLAEFLFGPMSGSTKEDNRRKGQAQRRINQHLGPDPDRRPELTIETATRGNKATVYTVVLGTTELLMKEQIGNGEDPWAQHENGGE